jgi:predicted O-linked N-acetylglucosamine transferase (SPINDLY family)
VDYRLTDPQLDPPGLDDQFYAEKSIRLPHAFWCYDPLTSEPRVNALPVESNGFVTFGCLNNLCKLNERTLRLWAEVLQSVPHSRLLLLAPLGKCRDWVLGTLGISAERIEFIPYKPRAEYLEVYHRIDIALDTMPYNGHTTTFDSLWMGVPVVTRAGQTCVSRGGLSILSNLGLTDLVAKNAEEFVHIATNLADDRARLAGLRKSLRHRMETSPLMDGLQFACDFEAALRDMWRTWCKTRNLPSNPQ